MTMKIKSGNYEIYILNCGTFKLDGGAMFGVVPKTLWSKTNPADELNRITLGMYPILIKGPTFNILVDAGIGNKFNSKWQEIYGICNQNNQLIDELNKIGLKYDDITDIIITHLHFDHCGGLTTFINGNLELIFKNANIYLQKDHYHAATNPTERDRASFLSENLNPILNSPNLKLIDGNLELFPGIKVLRSDGHTIGMQMVIISTNEHNIYYLSDLIPTSSHVPIPYVMGYDLFPVTVIYEKKAILNEIIDKDGIVIFEHDYLMPVAKISKNEKGYYAIKYEI